MIKYIQEYANYEDNMNVFKFLKCEYKFSDNLEKNEKVAYKIDELNNKVIIDSIIKNEKRNLIIFNILRLILDFTSITEFLIKENQISWTIISDKLKKYSFDDCKNQWNKILHEFDLEKSIQIKRDIKLVKK